MTATQVLVVAKLEMLRLLRTEPGLQDRFITHLLARNRRLETTLTDQLLCSSEERLAHLRSSRKMVGTTRPRVNAFMGKFKRLGFIIEDEGGIVHVNPARLREVQRFRVDELAAEKH